MINQSHAGRSQELPMVVGMMRNALLILIALAVFLVVVGAIFVAVYAALVFA